MRLLICLLLCCVPITLALPVIVSPADKDPQQQSNDGNGGSGSGGGISIPPVVGIPAAGISTLAMLEGARRLYQGRNTAAPNNEEPDTAETWWNPWTGVRERIDGPKNLKFQRGDALVWSEETHNKLTECCRRKSFQKPGSTKWLLSASDLDDCYKEVYGEDVVLDDPSIDANPKETTAEEPSEFHVPDGVGQAAQNFVGGATAIAGLTSPVVRDWFSNLATSTQ